MCDRQYTKKYTERPSPPYPAQECRNQTKKGNDGRYYVSTRASNGIYRWQYAGLGSRSRSPSPMRGYAGYGSYGGVAPPRASRRSTSPYRVKDPSRRQRSRSRSPPRRAASPPRPPRRAASPPRYAPYAYGGPPPVAAAMYGVRFPPAGTPISNMLLDKLDIIRNLPSYFPKIDDYINSNDEEDFVQRTYGKYATRLHLTLAREIYDSGKKFWGLSGQNFYVADNTSEKINNLSEMEIIGYGGDEFNIYSFYTPGDLVFVKDYRFGVYGLDPHCGGLQGEEYLGSGGGCDPIYIFLDANR